MLQKHKSQTGEGDAKIEKISQVHDKFDEVLDMEDNDLRKMIWKSSFLGASSKKSDVLEPLLYMLPNKHIDHLNHE